ncbi:MAG: hypothetical protein NC419_01295 [Muribaculaceae bacterium]|nr:hypothetical protein [Muribaculaceae bacterium]
MNITGERARVDGVDYSGYQAIKINRQITEEFAGVLTDEKVDKIVEKYGFPQEVVAGYGYFRDGNFLNTFVSKYLSDGYFYHWDNYQIATHTYPIADTELGEVRKHTGKEIILEYSDGWAALLDMLGIGLICACIVVFICVSAVFSTEGQLKMLPLLFTTKEGKRKDIFAKMAAAFVVSIGILLGVVFFCFLTCAAVYGLDGADCFIGITKECQYITAVEWSATTLSVKEFITIVLIRSLVGVLLLCATTVYLSARARSTFHAVISSAICFGAPILVWLMFSGIHSLFGWIIQWLIYATPLYLVMYNSLYDIFRSWTFYMWIEAADILFLLIGAFGRYRRQQAG